MANLQEIKNILDGIKKDLENKATNAKIDELVDQIRQRDIKINALEEKVAFLEGKISVIEKVTTLLERKLDDGEQYQRRPSLRIDGIPMVRNERETGEVCLRKVKEEVAKLGLKPESMKFDRAHRIGREKFDADGNALPRQMIFRMTSWADRTQIYKARNKERGAKVKFYIDLTKRRFQLKKLASDRVKGNPLVDFVFTDVNCNLCIRFVNGDYKFFNSSEELDNLLL